MLGNNSSLDETFLFIVYIIKKKNFKMAICTFFWSKDGYDMVFAMTI